MICAAASDIRLNAAPHTGAEPFDAPSTDTRTCVECGGSLAASRADAEFCSADCRMGFNNRRAKRGAELYDLFMALRHDRATATLLKVWRLLNRLAAIFRAEDLAERAGRRSWRHPAEIIARRPYLKADVLDRGRRGRGR